MGAGLSGLIAGVRLAEAGVDVTVIDREDRVGGRIYSATLGGTQVNLGAQYFFESDNDDLNHYVRKMKKFSPEGGRLGALWDGTFVSAYGEALFTMLPIPREALEQLDATARKMRKTRKELLRGRDFVFDRLPTSPAWSDLDNISAAEYLADCHPDGNRSGLDFFLRGSTDRRDHDQS